MWATRAANTVTSDQLRVSGPRHKAQHRRPVSNAQVTHLASNSEDSLPPMPSGEAKVMASSLWPMPPVGSV